LEVIMSRTARITAVLTAIVAAVTLQAQAALAYVAPIPPQKVGPAPSYVAPVITHVSSGLGAWTVLFIAIAAVAVGAALAEGVRSLGRRRHAHRLATA
jgi:hypothetical protein